MKNFIIIPLLLLFTLGYSGFLYFTPSELSAYNGQDGEPAYVAVDGVIYDVSAFREWKRGEHHGHSAGKDLSKQIKRSPHGKAILKRAKIVGKLVPPITSVELKKATNYRVINTLVYDTNATEAKKSSGKKSDTAKGKVVGKLLPMMSLKELSAYNGQDGEPAYVAVDGVVYDVSALREWKREGVNTTNIRQEKTSQSGSKDLRMEKLFLKELRLLLN